MATKHTTCCPSHVLATKDVKTMENHPAAESRYHHHLYCIFMATESSKSNSTQCFIRSLIPTEEPPVQAYSIKQGNQLNKFKCEEKNLTSLNIYCTER
jgi:hypothetical protein